MIMIDLWQRRSNHSSNLPKLIFKKKRCNATNFKCLYFIISFFCIDVIVNKCVLNKRWHAVLVVNICYICYENIFLVNAYSTWGCQKTYCCLFSPCTSSHCTVRINSSFRSLTDFMYSFPYLIAARFAFPIGRFPLIVKLCFIKINFCFSKIKL